jgi:hypothetical protein
MSNTCWMGVVVELGLPESAATAADAASNIANIVANNRAGAGTPTQGLRERFIGFPPGS